MDKNLEYESDSRMMEFWYGMFKYYSICFLASTLTIIFFNSIFSFITFNKEGILFVVFHIFVCLFLIPIFCLSQGKNKLAITISILNVISFFSIYFVLI